MLVLAGCGSRPAPLESRQTQAETSAVAALRDNRPSSAGAFAGQALELARARDDRPGQARALLLRARALAANGSPAAADDLAAARQAAGGDRDLIAAIALQEAELLAAARKLEDAERVLESAGSAGSTAVRCRILASRALIAAALARPDVAAGFAAQARRLADDPASEALCALALARTALAAGDRVQAVEHARRGAAQAQVAEDPVLAAAVLEALGDALRPGDGAADAYRRAADAMRAARRPDQVQRLEAKAR